MRRFFNDGLGNVVLKRAVALFIGFGSQACHKGQIPPEIEFAVGFVR